MTAPDPDPTAPQISEAPDFEDSEDPKESSESSAPSGAADDADSLVAVKQAEAKPKKKKPKVVLCPYCGHAQQQGDKCSSCGGLFEPLSRRATQIAMGPWTIRNKTHPFRPGCSYEVLVQMIEAGRVGPMTVLRGPTTRQFWSVARNVPGVAHLLGYCHACGAHVAKDDSRCPSCDAVFRAVKQRNELGLQFPNRRAAEAAQRSLNRLLGLAPAESESLDEAEASDAEALTEDQEQVLAAAATAPADQAPASIFAQDAEPAGPASDDGQGDLISDLLGEVTPAPASPSRRSASVAEPEAEPADTAPVRAETPSPLQPGDAATPHPAALPPRREINWLVITLIGLNVLVAAAVIVYVATRPGDG
ncbi:MAG: hypothetical protein AAF086_01485 [Planctomycetota bacterium]